mmetsp:Transcript_132868/g.230391  ORF Transcript_132868/g.230391 Transcript_132868/m.230391 type:complete len:213 (-) Transcript_132868:160-798(-)
MLPLGADEVRGGNGVELNTGALEENIDDGGGAEGADVAGPSMELVRPGDIITSLPPLFDRDRLGSVELQVKVLGMQGRLKIKPVLACGTLSWALCTWPWLCSWPGEGPTAWSWRLGGRNGGLKEKLRDEEPFRNRLMRSLSMSSVSRGRFRSGAGAGPAGWVRSVGGTLLGAEEVASDAASSLSRWMDWCSHCRIRSARTYPLLFFRASSWT